VPGERVIGLKGRVVEVLGGVVVIPSRSITARERRLLCEVKETTSAARVRRRRTFSTASAPSVA